MRNSSPSLSYNLQRLEMAEEYRLIYLNCRGRAELIRFILAQAGVEYEDHRIELAEWAEKRAGIAIAVYIISEMCN